MAPRQGVHSAEIHGQRTRPGKWFQTRRAFSCRYCLLDRLHELHGPFLLGLRTHVVAAKSSSFSCLSMSAGTLSFVSYPNIFRQARQGRFPNSVKCAEEPEYLVIDIYGSNKLVPYKSPLRL